MDVLLYIPRSVRVNKVRTWQIVWNQWNAFCVSWIEYYSYRIVFGIFAATSSFFAKQTATSKPSLLDIHEQPG